MGADMGLTGEALARFVVNAAAKEEERANREEERRYRRWRDHREDEYREEERRYREKRDEEDRQRFERKMELKQEEVEAEISQPFSIAPYDGKGDFDDFLTHFERVALLNKWKPSSWAARLVTLLQGQARDACLRVPPERLHDYESLKAALLREFRLDAHAYCKRFRSMRKLAEETFIQFLERLKVCLSRWCTAAGRDYDSAEDLRDLFLQEQFLATLNPDLVSEVKREEPDRVEEVARITSKVVGARRAGRMAESEARASRKSRDHGLGAKPHAEQKAASLGQSSSALSDSSRGVERTRGVTCFLCGKLGHVAKECRQRKKVSLVAQPSFRQQGSHSPPPSHCVNCAAKQYSPRCEAFVNGVSVPALRDTGAHMVVVARHLVSPDSFTGATVRVVLAESRCTSVLPIARVDFQSPFVEGRLDVAVMEAPVEEVLIGNTAWRENGTSVPVPVYSDASLVGALETRAQAAARAKELPPLPVKDIQIHVSRQDLEHQQDSDPDLCQARELAVSKAVKKTRSGEVMYFRKQGILMRRFKDHRGEATQICVPKELRSTVLLLAHEAPMSGHLGVKRTQGRVFPHFYWPGMCADIRRFVRSCDRCQKTVAKGRVPKVPLVKMPLISEPFSRVAVDIVGPISPSSESGNRYILTMVDYATRYPEAVALKHVSAETVAEALFTMWTRTGVPAEVLTDRGSQFTGSVMQEVYRLLSVRGLTTTPYHAQCNGLVERFNATLKAMLRRLSHEKPQAWDRWIPALLFAYREVPQESTGYSPFELLYGRTVRGPMQILREHWLHPERIAESCTIAQQNLERASRRYKGYFDAKAKQRQFAEGSKVLLLRPTKQNKLELEWQGPYTVLRRVGITDYCVRIGEKEKLYHANLLKEYIERTPRGTVALAVIEDPEVWEGTRTVERDIPLMPLEATEGPEDVVLAADNSSLKEAIREMTRGFRDVLTDLPACTNLETCTLNLTSDAPIRAKQYPLSYSQRETIQEEVQQMLKMGVIEPSSSPYSSPIVLVKKKDGKVRFCVDFRHINKITVFDAEPMPDVEALFSRLSAKKVFSKLDLSKGYWQIPMAEADRPKTAFTTPQGHFQWCVMPFGLKTAGAVFSRMMRKLVLPLNSPDVDNFMDDVLISSADETRHLRLLRSVFSRLSDCKLTARPSKCFLGHRELDYLGHHVGAGKIWPDAEKNGEDPRITSSLYETTAPRVSGPRGVLQERFEPYLYGKEFVVQVDHAPLQYLDRAKTVSGRLTRWALQLQPFSFRVQAIPGKENVGADFLSRLPDGGGEVLVVGKRGLRDGGGGNETSRKVLVVFLPFTVTTSHLYHSPALREEEASCADVFARAQHVIWVLPEGRRNSGGGNRSSGDEEDLTDEIVDEVLDSVWNACCDACCSLVGRVLRCRYEISRTMITSPVDQLRGCLSSLSSANAALRQERYGPKVQGTSGDSGENS
ncbi:uncharacterized protein LOC143286334 [Babylonia areolata]|uniref:uncharacterized protein LOC143286334 n=1 Tax=Babylonia areolata TaxID=304850 RepID=UPI003FCF770D